jgi:hypothetical protein
VKGAILIASAALLVSTPAASADVPTPILDKIHRKVHRVHRLEAKMGERKTPYRFYAEHHRHRGPRLWALNWWTEKLRKTKARYRSWRKTYGPASIPRWVYDGLVCIHGHEGAWNDPNPPYWGGLQMDRTFMIEYGPEFVRAYGTADHWPAIDQILAASRAVLGWHNPYDGRSYGARGFGPWPKTRLMCGV